MLQNIIALLYNCEKRKKEKKKKTHPAKQELFSFEMEGRHNIMTARRPGRPQIPEFALTLDASYACEQVLSTNSTSPIAQRSNTS
ncbi:hypothetical protein L873DRAFT_908379 [Choiromyces venosus 120613-1]|uniref:Uncharacterized protein n=1 Tax=Choiromyces venosus 120613-1 TaxID=1336337 RepID=A0A3N4JR46_9PEZI|nr:hypothetical protein L873DRAFT_908379 [Choiromyces venosus 120613-1]